MAQVNKMDSNFTELRYAVEQSPGVLPGTPTWFPLEPNEYKDFGGELVTKARTPINFTRQRKKGVPVDLNVTAGYVQDVTATNSEGLLQSFMFANSRVKAQLTDVAVVDGTNDDYEPASGGTGFAINDLIFAADFVATSNNGLKLVDAHPTATSIPVAEDLVTAAGNAGTITRVGTQFPSGFASIDATVSEFPKLVITGNVAATGVLTATGNPANNDTVTIGSRTYTFKTALTPAANEVLIGATASDSLDNLIAAITGAAGSGTLYGAGTVVHADVTAAAGAGDTMDVTAIYKGLTGNTIVTTEVSANLSFGGGTLSGGAGKDARSLGLIPGEFVFVGGDDTSHKFATAANNGFARVRTINADDITFDKTQGVMVDDNGAGKLIRVFYGHPLKNEVDRSLIVKRTLQFERVLGAPDDSFPTQVESEYVTNALANQAVLDAQTAEFLLLDMEFMAGDNEQRSAATGVKSGNRPALVESDAFNTTNDISLIKMALVTPGDSCPTPLFAYLTDLKITVNNNARQNKALSVFGSLDVTAGTFEVTAEVTAYFQTVSAITAARNNTSVTLEAHFVKENKGFSVDLPLIVIAKAMPEVKLDEPVMLPLESDAATAKIIDPNLDYTLMFTFWSYLPDAAE